MLSTTYYDSSILLPLTIMTSTMSCTLTVINLYWHDWQSLLTAHNLTIFVDSTLHVMAAHTLKVVEGSTHNDNHIVPILTTRRSKLVHFLQWQRPWHHHIHRRQREHKLREGETSEQATARTQKHTSGCCCMLFSTTLTNTCLLFCDGWTNPNEPFVMGGGNPIEPFVMGGGNPNIPIHVNIHVFTFFLCMVDLHFVDYITSSSRTYLNWEQHLNPDQVPVQRVRCLDSALHNASRELHVFERSHIRLSPTFGRTISDYFLTMSLPIKKLLICTFWSSGI